MAKTKISEFSSTPGNNTDIDGINIAEGCAPSGINDAIRELMAQLKDFQAGDAGDSITVVGTLAAKGTSSAAADLKLYEDTDNGTNYVGFIAPASIASNVQWTLPSADGSSGQALQTNGSGTLSFATLGISAGGTGQTTANAAFNALAPSQTSNAGRYLKTDGTNTSWDLLDISTADITGTLATTNGGTGLTSFSANQVFYASSTSAVGQSSNLTFDGTILTTPRINITNTGTGATFSSSGGSGMRIYGSSGTNQWDVYLNSTNIRFSDNTGGGKFVVDTGATIEGITVGRGAGAVAQNTAVGFQALNANTTGNFSTAVGYAALAANTTGQYHTAVGRAALNANTTGGSNSAFGYNSLGANTTGNSNVAVGLEALQANTTASNNTAVGYQAAYTNTTGNVLTAVGYKALFANTTGVENTAVGQDALGANTTGGYNTGLGVGAIRTNTTGANNTAVGWLALHLNTTASNNTAVGYQAGYSNTTGTGQVALGYQALYSATTGSYNTAVGERSAYGMTTGERNVAVGYTALNVNTTGVRNVAMGMSALEQNSTGSYNVGIGYQALTTNTTASENTAVGYQAGYSNTTGAGVVAIGWGAGYTNTTGSYNTYVGTAAGRLNSTSSGNTFVGIWAGYNTTGGGNTFIGCDTGGFGAGYLVTTGTKNTILGAYNGNEGGLDIRTSSNYIVLSDGDGNPRGVFDNSGNFLVGATATQAGARFYVNGNIADDVVRFYNANASPYGAQVYYSAAAPNGTANGFLECYDTGGQRATIRSNGGLANYQGNDVNLSDRREKTNFAPAKSYLDTICAIPVQTFNYIDQSEDDPGLTLGVVAQDVQAVAPELVSESNWASRDEEPKMRLSIYQTDLQYALMKCIQELKSELDSVKAELATLKGN